MTILAIATWTTIIAYSGVKVRDHINAQNQINERLAALY